MHLPIYLEQLTSSFSSWYNLSELDHTNVYFTRKICKQTTGLQTVSRKNLGNFTESLIFSTLNFHEKNFGWLFTLAKTRKFVCCALYTSWEFTGLSCLFLKCFNSPVGNEFDVAEKPPSSRLPPLRPRPSAMHAGQIQWLMPFLMTFNENLLRIICSPIFYCIESWDYSKKQFICLPLLQMTEWWLQR